MSRQTRQGISRGTETDDLTSARAREAAIRLTGRGGGSDVGRSDQRLAVLWRRVVSLRGKGIGFLDAKIKEEVRSGAGRVPI